MMPTPADGVRYQCTTCGGAGVIEEPKAAMLTREPGVHTVFAARKCRPCEGTGWLPPRHPEPKDEPPTT